MAVGFGARTPVGANLEPTFIQIGTASLHLTIGQASHRGKRRRKGTPVAKEKHSRAVRVDAPHACAIRPTPSPCGLWRTCPCRPPSPLKQVANSALQTETQSRKTSGSKRSAPTARYQHRPTKRAIPTPWGQTALARLPAFSYIHKTSKEPRCELPCLQHALLHTLPSQLRTTVAAHARQVPTHIHLGASP